MFDRRTLLQAATIGAAAASVASAAAQASAALPANPAGSGRYRPPGRLGLGGAPFGNSLAPKREEDVMATVGAAWDAGIRYFDTSPWYGLGLSERRFGVYLQGKPRDAFVLSTKVGRLLKPDAGVDPNGVGNWRAAPPFRHVYDYTAAGTRRSVEDSLQRLGLASIDIVFIHDLSPDNKDLGARWTEKFEEARTGAMPELERMRKEGIIKAWGLGVNTLEPALKAFEVADPDIILSATQYSLIKHEDALNRLMPVAQRRGASIVVGAPLNNGFLAGRDRYDYAGAIPDGALEKRLRLVKLAREHGTDLRTASLHFCNAHPVVSAVIPGASVASQPKENADSLRRAIPGAFWAALKREGLIADAAPIPSA